MSEQSGTRPPITSTQAGYNRALNGYRGFCALLVFLFHSGNAGVIPLTEVRGVTEFLWSSLRYGVEMFFMISGYVILGSLGRHASIAQFLKDRFIRIYSAWLPALVAVSVVCSLFDAKMFEGLNILDRISLFFVNLLLLPPLVSTPLVHRGSWSLTYEWVFYLAAAVGTLVQRQRAGELRWALGACIVLSAIFVALFPRSTFFMTGVVVFLNADWFERRRHWLRFPLLSTFVFLVAWRFTEVDEAALSITYLDLLRDCRWIGAALAFIASLHMFASVVHRSSRQLAFLESRFFQFFGSISYSFYLWHALVMSAVKRIVTPYLVPHVGVALGFVVFLVASGAIATVISWASWRFFEVRLARVAQRFVADVNELQSSRAT